MLGPRRFDPRALVGKSLQQGRYVLKQFLGQGSFAYVYRAEEMLGGTRLRDVAVKWVVEGEIDQILREAQALAAMPPHPNIVTFLTTLTLAPPAPGLMLVLEFVEGRSMDKLIEDGRPRSAEETQGMLDGVLGGLAHAHAHGIVHRDLKPENVMSKADGTFKITDFGIARNTDPGKATSGEVIKGTPAYMAPEQFGKHHDHRVDLYAAGVMAFELLVGKRPFEGTPAEIMRGHVLEAPPIPDRLPGPMREFLARALAKDPEQRFVDADHMRQVLAAAARGESGVTLRRRAATLAAGTGEGARKHSDTSHSLAGRSAAALRPVATVELHPEATPPAEEPWPEAARETRLIAAVFQQALPGAGVLAERAAGAFRIAAALKRPVLRWTREERYEARRVVERYETYRNERLPRPTYDAPENVDPFSPEFELEKPTEASPESELRLAGSERQAKCLSCKGRGRTLCPACKGRDSAACGECRGTPERECGECQGMGDRIGYLVIEARLESRTTHRILKSQGLSSDYEPQDLEGAPARLMFCARGTWLEPSDIPSPFLWPQAEGAGRELLGQPLPDGSRPETDEARLEWIFAGRVEGALLGMPVAFEAVPEAGFACADARVRESAGSWAKKLLTSAEAWDRKPEEMLAAAIQIASSPESGELAADAQAGALAMAERLLGRGETERYKELRKSFADLLALDEANKWRPRWNMLLGGRRRAQTDKFLAALEGTAPPAAVGETVRALIELEAFSQEGPALFRTALDRVSELVRRGEFERSEPLVQALSLVPWPVSGGADAIKALSKKALEARCQAAQQAADSGGAVEPLFKELSHVLAICPELGQLGALARAVRKRLWQEFREGRIVDGFRWGRRLAEELSHPRPDLAGLFANLLEGNEDSYVSAVNEALADEERYVEALELLTLPDVKLDGDPRVAELAASLDAVLVARLSGPYARSAGGGQLSETVEAEVTRSLGAWMRLQNWSPGQPLPATFVPHLWAMFEPLLRGSGYSRAQPLLDLADQVAVVRDHPELGPRVRAARESNVEAAIEQATEILRSGGDFDRFAGIFDSLANVLPRHKAITMLVTELQASLNALAQQGRIEEVTQRGERILYALKERRIPEAAWLRDPAMHFSSEFEKFVFANGADPVKLPQVLRLLEVVRARDYKWAPQVGIRLDHALDQVQDRRPLELKAALLPARLVEAALEPASAFGLMAARARESLDRNLRRVAGLVMLPLAFYVWPKAIPAARVVPVQKLAPTFPILATWLVMAVGFWLLMKATPRVVRMAMRFVDSEGRKRYLLAIAWGVLGSAAAFALGAAGARATMRIKR